MGTAYKKQCCVLIGSHLGLPEFGQVHDIVVQDSQVYLVVKVLNTVHFCQHYYSYRIFLSTDSRCEILQPLELPDYQVLHIYHVTSGTDTMKFIMPKYDIDSCITA